MAVRFEWLNPEKRVMRYVAEGDWNWHDYHRCVRISIYSMMNHPHLVHSLIDLRGSTRPKLPSGLAAHVRTFGKQYSPSLSGQAVVIGISPDILAQMAINDDATLETEAGVVYFVQTDEALQARLALLNAELSS